MINKFVKGSIKRGIKLVTDSNYNARASRNLVKGVGAYIILDVASDIYIDRPYYKREFRKIREAKRKKRRRYAR